MLNPFRIKSKLELKNANSDAYKSTIENDTLTADATVKLPNFATNTLASVNNAQTFTADQTFARVNASSMNITNSSMFINSNTTLGAISLTYIVDTTSNTVDLTLPAIGTGMRIVIKDAKDTFGTNRCRIIPSTGDKLDGYAANDTLDLDFNGAWIELQANSSNERWVLTTSAIPNATTVLTASKVLVTDPSGYVAASSVAASDFLTLMANNAYPWVAYTSTLTNAGAGATQSFIYRVVGKTLEIKGTIKLGTETTGTIKFTIPSGYNAVFADYSIGANGTNSYQTVGVIQGYKADSSKACWGIVLRDATSTTVFYGSVSNTFNVPIDLSWGLSSCTFAAGDCIMINISIPI